MPIMAQSVTSEKQKAIPAPEKPDEEVMFCKKKKYPEQSRGQTLETGSGQDTATNGHIAQFHFCEAQNKQVMGLNVKGGGTRPLGTAGLRQPHSQISTQQQLTPRGD